MPSAENCLSLRDDGGKANGRRMSAERSRMLKLKELLSTESAKLHDIEGLVDVWKKACPPNPTSPIDARTTPTNPQEANAQFLEKLYQESRKYSPADPLRGWLSAPRLNHALAQCEAGGVSLRDVANRQTLLPRATRVCLRLLQWICDVATQMKRTIIARHPRFSCASRIAWEISEEHSRALPLRLAMHKAQKTHV